LQSSFNQKFPAVVIYTLSLWTRWYRKQIQFSAIAGYAIKPIEQEERKTQEVCHDVTDHHNHHNAWLTETAMAAVTAMTTVMEMAMAMVMVMATAMTIATATVTVTVTARRSTTTTKQQQ